MTLSSISREAAGVPVGAATARAYVPAWVADFTRGGMPAGCSFARASGARVIEAGGQAAVVAANTPRFDHDPDSGAPLGLLMENAATNYFLNSAAPVSQSCALAAGTYTLWVDGGSCTVSAGSASGSGFGTATADNPVTFSITAAGSVDMVVGGSPGHVQCEGGAFATSRIATGGSATTRDADTLVMQSLGGMAFNQEGGTFVVAFRLGAASVLSQRLLELSTGSYENRMVAGFAGTTNCRLQVCNGGAWVADVIAGSVAVGQSIRFACRYNRDNTYAACFNGGSVATGGGALPAGGFVDMAMGNGLYTSSFGLCGHLQRIAYFPRCMNDSELEMLSR